MPFGGRHETVKSSTINGHSGHFHTVHRVAIDQDYKAAGRFGRIPQATAEFTAHRAVARIDLNPACTTHSGCRTTAIGQDLVCRQSLTPRRVQPANTGKNRAVHRRNTVKIPTKYRHAICLVFMGLTRKSEIAERTTARAGLSVRLRETQNSGRAGSADTRSYRVSAGTHSAPSL